MTLRTMKTFFTVAVLSVSLSAFASTNATSANHATSSHNATVVSGHATLSSVAATTTITQSSQTAVINWRDFSTRAGDAIHIHQPNALAMAIIRVQGDSASHFNGRLTANGQVLIVNANGMVAGETAQFKTAGLVLSTGKLSERDAKQSNYRFHNATAPIDFHGTIDGGYVAMIAQQITNHGSINANGERVELTAADSVTLNLNHGNFAGVQVDKGALDAVADNAGSIQSDGGVVHVTATAASSTANATVNHSGLIAANSTATATGEIMLISDMGVGKTTISGELYAKADGHLASNGGFIETSGSKIKISDNANISTKANNGKTGKWLLDPYDFTIAASGGDITGAALSAALGTTDVTLQTTNTAASCTGATCGTGDVSGNGDIHVNDTVNWSANTLTLDAYNDININSSLNATGNAKLALKYGQSSANGGTSDYHVNAPVNLPAGLASQNIFTTQKGSTASNQKNYTIITSLGSGHNDTSGATLQGIWGNLAGNYVLGADIDATATKNWVVQADQDNKGFWPIGKPGGLSGEPGDPFRGVFDGLGHKITDMKIASSNLYSGLFSAIAKGSQLRNVGMIKTDLSTRTAAGVLVGLNEGSVTNSYSHKAEVYASFYFNGGLVGQNKGNISNSYVTEVVVSDASIPKTLVLGGLVGINEGNISNSYAKGAVRSVEEETVLGGLVGHNSKTGRISNSYFEKDSLMVGVTNFGGLVGVNSGIISNSFAFCDPFLQGWNGERRIGGLVGANYGKISNSYWKKTQQQVFGCNTSKTCAGATGLTAAEMKKANNFSWDIDKIGGQDKIWRIYEDNTLPMLKVFLKTVAVTPNGTRSKIYNGSPQSNAPTGHTIAKTTSKGNPVNESQISGTASYTSVSGKDVGDYAGGVTGLYSTQQGYDLVTGTALTITKANLTLTGSRIYDGTTKAAGDTLTATGVNGETFSVTGAGDTSNLSSKNASATAQTLASVTGLALGTSSNGGLASNYNVLSTAGSQYTINLGQFTLSYHANGGKTAPASVKVTAGSSTTLAAGISRDGYTFAGWNSKADGTGTNYAAGISFTMPNADTALYAKWTKKPVKSKEFTTPNGTGKLTISGGGQTCNLKSATYYQKAQALSGSPQAPNGLTFKQGLVGFVAERCDKGSTINIAIDYPNTIASGAKLTKWGKTASNKTNHWYDYPADIRGNRVTYAVIDGKEGDDDLTANGKIVDPAGVSSRANAPSATRPVPSLGTAALLLMALLLALVAGFGRRYRRI